MRYRRHVAFGLVVAAYSVYVFALFWSSSAVVDGERYFSLGDDAMISMRYARNFAHGHGLVWNAGERPVEGYTNPLWVLLMAAIHALPLPVSKTSGAVKLLAMALLVANLFITQRLAQRVGASAAAAVGAAVLTALHYPLTVWSLQGSEVALVVPLVGLALLTALHGIAADRFSAIPYWMLGAGTLVRPDAAVLYVGLLAGMATIDRARRAAHLTYGIAVLVLFVALQTAFRFAYYGEWLPNTYYLKMTGYPTLWRIAWGVRDLAGFAWHRWIVFALAASGVYWRPRYAAIVATVAAAQFAYVAYIGPADSRFTTVAMPLAFVLAAVGADAVIAAVAATGRLWHFPFRSTVVENALTIQRRQAIWACALLAAVAAWTLNPEAFRFRGFPGSVLDRDKALDDLTTTHARVAVAAAGTLYFLDRDGVDVLGKNDYTLARAPVHRSFRRFGAGYVSGHMKWDYAYSIGTLAPDVVAELWRYPEDAEPYLEKYEPLRIGDETVYLLRGSPQIRWDRLRSRQQAARQ